MLSVLYKLISYIISAGMQKQKQYMIDLKARSLSSMDVNYKSLQIINVTTIIYYCHSTLQNQVPIHSFVHKKKKKFPFINLFLSKEKLHLHRLHTRPARPAHVQCKPQGTPIKSLKQKMPRQAQNSRISLTLIKLLLLLCTVVIEVKAQVGYLADDECKKTLLLSFSRFYSSKLRLYIMY